MGKVVMVDIDGVLNSNRSMLASPAFDETTAPPFRIPTRGDEVGARLLNRLCSETHATIVVTSSWLYVVGTAYTLGWLERTGTDPGFFHEDPTVRFGPDGRKETAILDWLHGVDVPPDAIAIVDDDSTLFAAGSPQLRKRLVTVREEDGIQLRHYQRLLRLLESTEATCAARRGRRP